MTVTVLWANILGEFVVAPGNWASMLVELLALLAVLAALFVIGLKGNKKTAAPPPPPVASPVKQ